ncbi:hypothetical protein ACFQ12_08720, partial [Methylobacterium trifolii]
MSDTSPLYIGENPAAVPMHRAVEKASLWLAGAACGLATAALLVFAVATESGTEAERIARSGGGYAVSLVSAL